MTPGLVQNFCRYCSCYGFRKKKDKNVKDIFFMKFKSRILGAALFFRKCLEGIEEHWKTHCSFPLPFPMPLLWKRLSASRQVSILHSLANSLGCAIKQFHAKREEEEDRMNGKSLTALGLEELCCHFQREFWGGNAAEQWEGSSGALDCSKQQKFVGFQLSQLTQTDC